MHISYMLVILIISRVVWTPKFLHEAKTEGISKDEVENSVITDYIFSINI